MSRRSSGVEPETETEAEIEPETETGTDRLELAETAVISRDDDVAGELARIDRGG